MERSPDVSHSAAAGERPVDGLHLLRRKESRAPVLAARAGMGEPRGPGEGAQSQAHLRSLCNVQIHLGNHLIRPPPAFRDRTVSEIIETIALRFQS